MSVRDQMALGLTIRGIAANVINERMAELAEMLRGEPFVRNVLDMAATARFALIGVGAVTSSATLVRYGYCSSGEIELFKRRGAVGDVLGFFYDAEGDILDHPDGSITLFPNRSEADLMTFRFGVSVGFGGELRD